MSRRNRFNSRRNNRKVLNIFAFGLLALAIYLNFIHKESPLKAQTKTSSVMMINQ